LDDAGKAAFGEKAFVGAEGGLMAIDLFEISGEITDEVIEMVVCPKKASIGFDGKSLEFIVLGKQRGEVFVVGSDRGQQIACAIFEIEHGFEVDARAIVLLGRRVGFRESHRNLQSVFVE